MHTVRPNLDGPTLVLRIVSAKMLKLMPSDLKGLHLLPIIQSAPVFDHDSIANFRKNNDRSLNHDGRFKLDAKSKATAATIKSRKTISRLCAAMYVMTGSIRSLREIIAIGIKIAHGWRHTSATLSGGLG